MADTQAIKDRLDIVQLIGEYVTLKKAGSNWKGNCPFHHEKTPSFMVQPDKQMWHCFGCSKGGDVFAFIQEIEGLEFPEALQLLAKRAGVEITNTFNDGNASQRSKLLEITKSAAYFFHHMLLDMEVSKPAREYLERRGVKNEIIIDWQIGFIPDQWDLLTSYLHKKGYAFDDLVLAGLTIKRDGADAATGRGYYDRFRGRVMFPISDVHGNEIGFTGRVLVETENSGGKYVNTPATSLYDKSRVLYGIHKAKLGIKAKDLAVLVEGQMDVIACHQAGMTNVVAASGTALTTDQIKLLKRYTRNLAMAFDADQAGQNAGKRGIGVALQEGMSLKVIQIPEGFAKDADECLKKDANVWFNAVQSAQGVMEWYFNVTLRTLDRTNPRSKQQVADTLLTEINHIPYAVERDEWIKRLSEAVDIDISLLRQEIKRIPEQKKTIVPAVAVAPPVQAVQLPKDQLTIVGDELWSQMLRYPAEYGAVRTLIKKDYFTAPLLASLYETAENLYTKDNQIAIDALRHMYHKEGLENTVDILLLKPSNNDQVLSQKDAKTELIFLAGRLREEWRKKRGKELTREIGLAEKAKDMPKLDILLQELQTL